MDLGASFLAPPLGAPPAEGCPAPERILQAALGELTPEENESFADHSAGCAVCTVAWQLARDFAQESGLAFDEAGAIAVERSRWAPARRWWLPAAALAATLAVVALLVPWRGQAPAPVPGLRDPGRVAIESLVPDGASLASENFMLTWSAGPEGTRYDIRVTDQRLEHLAGAVGLRRPEYTVPPDALAPVPAGSIVLWQVEAILPDGRRVVSKTFATRLE